MGDQGARARGEVVSIELRIIPERIGKHLGMAAATAGGWVATSHAARDVIDHVCGHGCMLAALPSDWPRRGRPVRANELFEIRRQLVNLGAVDDLQRIADALVDLTAKAMELLRHLRGSSDLVCCCDALAYLRGGSAALFEEMDRRGLRGGSRTRAVGSVVRVLQQFGAPAGEEVCLEAARLLADAEVTHG